MEFVFLSEQSKIINLEQRIKRKLLKYSIYLALVIVLGIIISPIYNKRVFVGPIFAILLISSGIIKI